VDMENGESGAHRLEYDFDEFITFRAGFSGKIGGLEAALSFLPAVDKDGNSDCPFAESLYAKKEEAAEFVPAWIEDMEENYLPAIRREIERTQSNQEVLDEAVNEMGLNAAQQQLYRGLDRQQGYLHRLIEEMQSMEEDLAWARRVLDKSNERKWPKGNPRKPVAALPGMLPGTGRPLPRAESAATEASSGGATLGTAFGLSPSLSPEPASLPAGLADLLSAGPMPSPRPYL
jgi:hypothetical protein